MEKLSTLKKKHKFKIIKPTHTTTKKLILHVFKIFARLKFCVNNNNNKNY